MTLTPKAEPLAEKLRDIALYGRGIELRCIETRPVVFWAGMNLRRSPVSCRCALIHKPASSSTPSHSSAKVMRKRALMNRSPCGGELMLRLAAAQRDQAVDAVDLVRRASRAGQQGALDVALGRTRLDAAQLDAAAVQRDVAQLFRQRLGDRKSTRLNSSH